MDTKEEFFVPDEVAEWIGLKKSEYLSTLIELSIPGDFGFEEYHQFNHLVPDTIQDPDKSFEDEADSYDLRTYVKSYSRPVLFHQVVIGIMLPDLKNKAEVLIPVLCFVSKKDEIVKRFSVGKVLSRHTLN